MIPSTIDQPVHLATALLRRLCTPADLDPCNPAHRAGFTQALQRDPTLPIPRELLEALNDRQLWQIVQQPPASAILHGRLNDPTARVETPIKDDEIVKTALLPSLEAAIVDAYKARRLGPRDIARLTQRFSLRRPSRRALSGMTHQREQRSRHRTNQKSAAAPSLFSQVKDCLTPQTSYWQLWNLPVERLSPDELAMLLPQWIKADPRCVAALLNVPGLDAETQGLAFRQWITHDRHRYPRQPIPLHLVEQAPPSALPALLRGLFRHELDITPPPTQAFLDNSLFLVALDDPETAATLRQEMTLAAWQDTLFSLIEADPDAPTATDPDARWFALQAKDAHYDIEKALHLHAQFTEQPPARQRALAPILLATLGFTQLI